MALVAAAVCPHPPLLVPAVAAGAAKELTDVRASCRAAAAGVLAAAAEHVFVVGPDIGARAFDLTGWAPDAPELPRLDVPEPLPLPLLLGAWLTAGAARSFVVVDPALDATECALLGAELAAAAPRVGLLVMGDGSACHELKAPGYLDSRARPYDDAVHQAFATADVDALLGLDPELSAELLVAGRPAWQVLAGAATGTQVAVDSATFVAPYGVGYHVVQWRTTDG